MELQEAILKRRSVRKFTEDVVTDEQLRQIFETVRWSPSWANTQVWELIVVRDKALIEKSYRDLCRKKSGDKMFAYRFCLNCRLREDRHLRLLRRRGSYGDSKLVYV